MATTSEIQVTEAYIGLLGRAPDPAGLAYWAAQLDAAIAAGDDAAVALKKLTNDITLNNEWLVDGDGALDVTGGTAAANLANAETVVTNMYDRLFDRTPPSQAELDYWAPKLVSGEFTSSEMAVALIQGAGTTDAAVLGYKQEAATYYVESVPQENFSRESAGDSVSAVNGPVSLAASKTATDYVVTGVGEAYSLTVAANDALTLTAGSDTVTGISGTGATIQAGDSITDNNAFDNDVLTVSGDDAFDMPTITGVEVINASVSKQLGGGLTVDADKLNGGTVNFTVAPTVEIAGVTVTGETVLTVNNLASNLSTNAVTGLTVDFDNDISTITTDTAITTLTATLIDDGATNIVLGNDSGGTLNISGSTATNDTATITANGNVTLDVGSVGATNDVEILYLSGGTNDVDFDLGNVNTAANMKWNTTGDKAVTLTGRAADFSGGTFTMGATTGLDIDTAGSLNLTGQGVFAGGIDLSVNMGGADTINLQSGNTITISLDQDAADILNIDAANDTAADSVTITLQNDAGELETADFETIQINTGATARTIDIIDMDDNDGAVTITSGGALTVTQTTNVGSLDIDGSNNVTLTGAVTSGGVTDVDAAVALVVGAGITSTNDVTLSGDSIAVTGTVAAANGDVSIVTDANDLAVDVTTATKGSVTLTGNDIDIGGAVTAQNDITITGGTGGIITAGAFAVNTTGAGGANTISITGVQMPDIGAIGSATTRDITISMSNDAFSSDLDGAVTATNSITLSDGKFDATGVTLTSDTVLITGDTDFVAGSVIAEALTITSTNDVTLTAIGEKTASEGVVLSGAAATGDIDVTVSGASTGTITVITGSGNDTVTMDEAAIINVQTGGGVDNIVVTDSTAGSVINTGDGDDVVDDNETVKNIFALGDGNDSYTPVAGSTSTVDYGDGTDTLAAGGLALSGVNHTNFEIMTIAGGTTISNALLQNDGTFEVQGNAALTISAPAAASTIDVSGLTFEVATPATVTINGSAANDVIIGSSAVDTVDPGVGTDTVTLGAGADTIVYASATDGLDTYKDFTSASDKYNTDFVTTAGTVGAGTTVGTTVAAADANVELNFTGCDVIEITGTLQNTITDFTNDTQVIQAICNDNSLTVKADQQKGLLVIYQGGNAYVYQISESNDGGVVLGDADGDITLVGVFEGIADGGLAPGDFI